MTDTTLLPFDLPSVGRKKLTVDFDGGNQSSDAGLLLLRHAERQLGVCRRLADAMPDRRDASRISHEMFEMVMARASAIVIGELPNCDEPSGDPDARAVMADLFAGFPGPVVIGFPSGHTAGAAMTLPFGVNARVIAGPRPRLVIEEAAVV